eukprot:12178500-Alexandrium_andersonii.AAC.1
MCIRDRGNHCGRFHEDRADSGGLGHDSWPMTVAVAAAQAGVTGSLKVAVQGAVGRLWQATPTR